jgi:LacI family transcriptional regulator
MTGDIIRLPSRGLKDRQLRKKQPRTHPTVTDVAKLAQVSVATVSRTYSSPHVVTEEAKQRVLQAAASLNYSPHPGARMLRSRKSHIVAAIIPTLDYAIFASLVNTFQEVMTRAGHLVIVLSVGFSGDDLKEKTKLLVERGAEALMFVGKIADPPLVEYLVQRRIPVVSTYTFDSEGVFPSVGFDNAEAIRRTMGHMLQLGHREFVFLSGPQSNNDRQAARIGEFNGVLLREGIDPDGRVIECEYTFGRGADALRQIRNERPETTCVICSSDVLAIGVLREARRLKFRIPEDLSVTGFDDIDFSAIADPSLTTVSVPAAQMGRISAEVLLKKLTTGQRIRPVLLDTSLILRESTGRPRVDGMTSVRSLATSPSEVSGSDQTIRKHIA